MFIKCRTHFPWIFSNVETSDLNFIYVLEKKKLFFSYVFFFLGGGWLILVHVNNFHISLTFEYFEMECFCLKNQGFCLEKLKVIDQIEGEGKSNLND